MTNEDKLKIWRNMTPAQRDYDRKVAKQIPAGANQAASQYTVDYCRHFFGVEYVFEISPKQKGGKWTQAIFRQVLKQEGHRTAGKFNQDQRDAYQIALHAKKLAFFQAAKLKR